MKSTLTILLFLFTVGCISLNATAWRINNTTGSSAHFSSLAAANSSTNVTAGDTLYIEPTPIQYATVTLTKPLTLIGNGYFLGENPQTQANLSMSNINGITLGAGSSGSMIMGCTLGNQLVVSSGISNIAFIRNRIYSVSANCFAIHLVGTANDILIAQNYVSLSSTNGYALIYAEGNTHNVLFYGNYMEQTNSSAYSLFAYGITTIENNLLKGNCQIQNSQFNSNILISGTFNGYGTTTYYNNIGSDNQFGSTNGNQSHSSSTLFLNTGSTDGKWQLRPGSPAIGAGLGGVDCGMFAGLHPYRLSGIPPIPSIYEYFQIQNTSTQQLQIDFSVKSND